jgi:hypothetical protein
MPIGVPSLAPEQRQEALRRLAEGDSQADVTRVLG